MVADGLIYVTSDKLYAIDPAGREAWSFDPGFRRRFLSDPALQGDDILFAFYQGTSIGIVAVHRVSHDVSWEWVAPSSVPRGVPLWLNVDGDNVLLAAGTRGPNVWMIESGGRVMWSAGTKRPPGGLWQSIPTAMDEGVALLAAGRVLEARRVSDGSILWRREARFDGTPAIAHGLVLVRSGSGLLALGVGDGAEVRRIRRVSEFAVDGERMVTWRWGAQPLGEAAAPPRIELRDLPSMVTVSSYTPSGEPAFGPHMLLLEDGAFVLESEDSFGRHGFLLAHYPFESGDRWYVELPDLDPGLLSLDADPTSITSTGGAILVTTGIGILYAFAPEASDDA